MTGDGSNDRDRLCTCEKPMFGSIDDARCIFAGSINQSLISHNNMR